MFVMHATPPDRTHTLALSKLAASRRNNSLYARHTPCLNLTKRLGRPLAFAHPPHPAA